jgi:Domain of unknown function (DUF4431)
VVRSWASAAIGPPSETKVIAAINRLVGKMVVVHGNPFAAMTAHHQAPIVMQVTHIESQ